MFDNLDHAYYKSKNSLLYVGNVLDVLKTLPDDFVDCVVTSPPYWSLRSYLPDDHPDKPKELGLESTFTEYITKLCDIFDEIRRILKPTGTCFINLGDSYAGSGNGTNDYRTEASKSLSGKRFDYNMMFQGKQRRLDYPSKSLCLIPQRFVIGMVERGWVCRNQLVWWKPNCMPSSVRDRFTVDYEPIFFFVKSRKYWFEQQYEAFQEWTKKLQEYNKTGSWKYSSPKNRESKTAGRWITNQENIKLNPLGRNMRCVWRIPTHSYSGAHFATFPPKLVEPMIKAGCPPEGIVLDPFCGTSTTGAVALKLGRRYIGIDLSEKYIKELSIPRLKETQGIFA